ncbi:MAG TPA: Uma2 family endonuclease [Candidatus Obscuribacterales bacterium]
MSIATAKRFTVAEYHRLSDLGFFKEDDRFELIHGEIIQIAAKGKAHAVSNTRLIRELIKLIGERATVRSQEPIILPADSEPEPDIAIVCNRPDDYLSAHPSPEDVLLLIEIADTSLSYDRNTKLALYAEAGIFDYWVLNLVENCLECYSEPYQSGQGSYGYRLKRILLPAETIALPPFPDLSLLLARVFPGDN